MMKLSGNRLIESIVGYRAKYMIHTNKGSIPFTNFTKPANESVVALITTAGVHLKSQPVFDVDAGDPTVRLIPGATEDKDLMISHTHFDRSDADQDINCVFPLARLRELAAEGIIKEVAANHYGLMGYIPNTAPLLEESIPFIVQQLQNDQVDAVILNPG
jgi:D-proline reductase (dithiol) PrdB